MSRVITAEIVFISEEVMDMVFAKREAITSLLGLQAVTPWSKSHKTVLDLPDLEGSPEPPTLERTISMAK